MHALVLADGDAPPRDDLDVAWPGWDEDAEFVIAADGGARLAGPLGLTIDAWVGDGDSIDDAALRALAAHGIPITRAPIDKDESDTELALRAALARGATRVTIVGALGGARLDHALANVALLALEELGGRDIRLVAADARVRMLRAPGADGGPVRMDLRGRVGDRVTLLPWGASATGVSTHGLHFPLRDESLPVGRSRGLSNLRIAPDASVTVRRGRLAVIESPARL